MQRADILIGMHGAALTYSLLMQPHAALVELWPQVRGKGRLLTTFGGNYYQRLLTAATGGDVPHGHTAAAGAAAVLRGLQHSSACSSCIS